ncbi:hypothetical protein [Endozoicomonas montiporae]|nr:hypothetical protein [Endozoicomonas montiporae]
MVIFRKRNWYYFFLKEPVSLMQLASVALIITGVIELKVTSSG